MHHQEDKIILDKLSPWIYQNGLSFLATKINQMESFELNTTMYILKGTSFVEGTSFLFDQVYNNHNL